jgi:hypothetical protein
MRFTQYSNTDDDDEAAVAVDGPDEATAVIAAAFDAGCGRIYAVVVGDSALSSSSTSTFVPA